MTSNYLTWAEILYTNPGMGNCGGIHPRKDKECGVLLCSAENKLYEDIETISIYKYQAETFKNGKMGRNKSVIENVKKFKKTGIARKYKIYKKIKPNQYLDMGSWWLANYIVTEKLFFILIKQ